MTDKKSKYKVVTTEGIVMYAKIHTPQKAYVPGEPDVYSLDLLVTDEQAKELLAEGLKPAKKMIDEDTKIPKVYDEFPTLKVFSFKRKTHKRDGSLKTPVEVVDADLNKIPPSILIGNGSKVVVSFSPYKMPTMKQTAADLLGVQVLELVPYSGRTSPFKQQKGFTVSSTTQESLDDIKEEEDTDDLFSTDND